MNPFTWFETQPWVAPALGVVAGVAALLKTFLPSHTVAYHVADTVLTWMLPAAAGSLGSTGKKANQ